MDLGCIDMGCVEKPKKEPSLEKEYSPKESVMSGSKLAKNSKAKDAVRSSLNKLTSQISKLPHRKTSPLNWFPRKKVEPYLKRKIKMLQEVDGMRSTLDETLGDSNPHYSRVLREKIAIREAAEKAMEARKAAMVEASWCRILQAARIESKEAEAQLVKAEVSAAEAARAVGVIMNDIPDSSQNHYNIETSSAKGGSTTHTVSATFESAFEVDKQVAVAVKAAFIKLANCPSISKDEFKELLRKISENPDTDETCNDVSTLECEPDVGSDVEGGVDKDSLDCPGEIKKRRLEADKFSMGNIVDMMLGRLRCLKEDELASLATIVATSGLNAALSEMENSKQHALSSSHPCKVPRTSVGGRSSRNSIIHAQTRGTDDGGLPSLDKFLVKRLTRLEREVLEAKNARKKESERKLDVTIDVKIKEDTTVPDLGSVLVKHSSKLEKEVEEARMNRKSSEIDNKKVQRSLNQDAAEVPSLDKFLVKRLTRLEREVQEARNRKATDSEEIPFRSNGDSSKDKENMDLNKIENNTNLAHEGGLSKTAENLLADCESLDKVLVKHVSRLEKEKLEFRADERTVRKPNRKDNYREPEISEGSLDQVLVKRKSRLEREKTAAAAAEERDDGTRYSVSRRQAREKELQEAWGGLSLGNSIRPHVSRLQRDKAAWLKAEEEERTRTVEGEV